MCGFKNQKKDQDDDQIQIQPKNKKKNQEDLKYLEKKPSQKEDSDDEDEDEYGEGNNDQTITGGQWTVRASIPICSQYTHIYSQNSLLFPRENRLSDPYYH